MAEIENIDVNQDVEAEIEISPDKLEPMPHQIECLKDSIGKLTKGVALYNTAPMGSGKTLVTFLISKHFNKDLFVVSPPGAIMKLWKDNGAKWGVAVTCISYDTLSGKGEKCNHEYLIKDNENGDYTPTDALYAHVDKGTIFVFDESDEAKNPKSQRLLACHAISRAIVTRKGNTSKIILLSATPIDKPIFAESVVKLLGIIKHKQLYKHDKANKVLLWKDYGYGDIYNYCCMMDRKKMDTIHPPGTKINKSIISNSMFCMLRDIIKSRMGTSMPKPKLVAKFYPEIRYYTVPPDELIKFKETMGGFRGAVAVDQNGGSNRGLVMDYLQAIEKNMLGLLIRIIEDKLKTLNKKLIVYVWFDASVDYLIKALRAFNPLRCDGQVDPDIRAEHIKLFQENNGNNRLIIAKPICFAKGINLDDTFGGYPRDIICVPDYRFNLIHQAAGRTHRSLTKSDTTFSLIFIKDADSLDILRVLAEKSQTTSEIVVSKCDNDNKVIYPGEYPVFIN